MPTQRSVHAAPTPRATSTDGAPRGERRVDPTVSAPSPRHATPGAAHAREDKKPRKVGILFGVGLVAVAVVLFMLRAQIFGGSAPARNEDARAASDTAPAPATQPVAETDMPQASAATAAEATREPAPTEPEPRKSEKAALKAQDPTSLDLAAIPDFQPTADTSADEWAEMSARVRQWMDAEAGAAGNRAKLELIEQKRKAVPAILNYFKKQDFATQEGRSNGDQCQKALMQICNGTNFDWRYADEAAGRPYDFPEDVAFCRRVVAEWVKAWRPVEHSIEAWIKLARLEERDPAEAERMRHMFGGQSSTDPAGADDD
ncbi:MAG: hypothetical protein HOP15_00890 [Planctomycetes bacterium]|nr:hypothetical protein [Planctomycetota bacterium]